MPLGEAFKIAPTPLELATHAVEHERAAQKPEELAELVRLLEQRDLTPAPASVLEIGVYRGGTLWLWRQLWPHARIIGVDNMSLERCPGCEQRVAHRDCSNRRISRALGPWPYGRLLVADSHAEETRDRVAFWLKDLGGLDFLHIDGDHSAAGVRRDFALYAPLVRRGGAIVLHDVAGDAFPGVVDFWHELLADESLWTRSPAGDVGPFTIFYPGTGADAEWGGLGVVPR